MGTNYYVDIPVCECCGRNAERIHVGKSSFGWDFMIARNDQFRLTTAKAWFKFLKKHSARIVDEYSTKITADDVIKLIKDRRGAAKKCHSHAGWEEDPDGYSISDGHEFF